MHAAFSAQSSTFSNSAAIAIADEAVGGESTAAAPYPTTIVVSGLSGVVAKVTVTLLHVTEIRPDDLDFLLVGPNGQTLLLMSDAGGANGSTPLNNVTLTFDDAAAISLPDSTQIFTGTVRPTNYNPGGAADTFPAPAPTPSAATTFATFNNTSPNGTWQLFVVDDALAAAAGQSPAAGA